MIRLFVNYYTDKSQERQKELEGCLKANQENPLIDEVIILDGRPTFEEYFKTANDYIASDNDVSIIANSDIYFNDTLRFLDVLKSKECYALCRWDESPLNHYNHADSQDAWVFRGKIKPINGDFTLGIPGCDNRIAFEIGKAGYTITNPSLTIQAIHKHKSAIRNYDRKRGDVIPPPYLTLPPVSLSSGQKKKTILHIALGKQTALGESLKALGEYHEIEWTCMQKNRPALQRMVLEKCRQIKPDIVFMQLQGPNVLDIETVKKMTGFRINWTGDVRQPLPRWYIDMGKHIDISLFSNMADVDVMRKHGCKADYLQMGFDDTIFNTIHKTIDKPEIVFMGNHYVNIFPLSQFRHKMVHFLKDAYNDKFAVYGSNWDIPAENLMYNEQGESETYQNCEIGINLSHFDLPLYTSDRIWRIMGSGAMCLTKYYPDIEKEFTDGENVVVWHDLADLKEKIDYYLANDEERRRIAQNGYDLVHNNYTWKHRINELKTIIDEFSV